MLDANLLSAPTNILIWASAIFIISLLLLVELAYRQNPEGGRSGIYRMFGQAVIAGFRSGIRGYFAPLHAAPWQAAWQAYRERSAVWWEPLAAWFSTLEQISFGPAQHPDRKSTSDGPVKPA
jgi:hypothetical protein